MGGMKALRLCFAKLAPALTALSASAVTVNVMDFGAKGDGVADDTAAIQAAIDAVAAGRSGKVFFPYTPFGYRIASPGIEEVGGRACRAQLYIPAGVANIELEGEFPPSLGHPYQVRPQSAAKKGYSPTRFGLATNNVCLVSTWSPPEERDPTARPWTILATLEGTRLRGKFSVSQVSIVNLEFRARLDKEKMYPTGGGVNLQNAGHVRVFDSQFCLDDRVGDTILGKSLQPNPCHTVGLMTSGDQNDHQSLRNVAVQGFRYGLVLGEHVAADYLYVHNCENGIVFHDATHLSTIGHVVAQHNRVILATTTTNLFGHAKAPCNVVVGAVDLESGRGLLPEVSRLVWGVSDPENRLRGSLAWHQPSGKNEFPVEGAEDFVVRRHGDAEPWPREIVPGRVELRYDGGAPVAVLAAPGGGKAEVALDGACVRHYRPAGQPQALWRPAAASATSEKGAFRHGGIPVCWPWTGKAPGLPENGFARLHRWRIARAAADGDSTTLVLSLSDTKETRAVWPHKFRLELAVTLGETLSVALTTVNADETPFTFGEALHPYFLVDDAERAEVRGFDARPRRDRFAAGAEAVQQGPVRVAGRVNLEFPGAAGAAAEIVDPALGRSIAVGMAGNAAAVVWNPGARTCAQIADMRPGDWRGFLCVEAASDPAAPVTLAPGESHTIGVEIGSRGL